MPSGGIRTGRRRTSRPPTRDYTGQPAGEFAAGRGTSDLIWSLARHLDGKTTGLPMPAYTEFRRAFPQARPFGGGASTHPASVLDEAMQACDAVIVSNPHNPTGQVIRRADLAEVAARHPASLLVVDESYIDFLADPAPVTLVGCGLGNVIVLRSPSKFFGLAGARSGAAWSARPLPACLRTDRTSWPVSAFAAQALKTALADTAWAARARQHLASDAAWLTQALGACGLDIAPGTLHFRLLTGPAPRSPGSRPALKHTGSPCGSWTKPAGSASRRVRISAPPVQERAKLAAALQTLEGQQ